MGRVIRCDREKEVFPTWESPTHPLFLGDWWSDTCWVFSCFWPSYHLPFENTLLNLSSSYPMRRFATRWIFHLIAISWRRGPSFPCSIQSQISIFSMLGRRSPHQTAAKWVKDSWRVRIRRHHRGLDLNPSSRTHKDTLDWIKPTPKPYRANSWLVNLV